MAQKTKDDSRDWPVIVHKSLTNPDVISTLRQRHFIIRMSESVVPGSVIFPLSGGVAFLIVSLDLVTSTDPTTHKVILTSELTERIDNFTKVHRHCFLLCKAPIHGEMERQIFSLIQRRYLTTRLQMIPVHNVQEAVTSMVTIAKGLCKPSADRLYTRLDEVVTTIQQTDFLTSALKVLNLNDQEILAVLENFVDPSSIASSSEEQFKQCGLSARSAKKLLDFFAY